MIHLKSTTSSTASFLQREVERRLKRIDNPDNMMVDFDGPRWFVHGMTVKAQGNRDKITAALQMIQDKLKLLVAQESCPICLDNFQAPPATLKSLIEEAKLENYEESIMEAKMLECGKTPCEGRQT